jgi:hypothetical protein
MKFLAVRLVSLMTRRECRVDHPFPNHVTRCWVRTKPPSAYKQWVAYFFKPTFWRLTLSTPERCHMDL